MVGTIVPIQVDAGVEPSTDKPEATTSHYTFSDKIRFRKGLPEKVGGWTKFTLNQGESIGGSPRSIFSYVESNLSRYLIGTNIRLYDVTGTSATNITPFKSSSTAIANSLSSYYVTLSNNPISTVSDSSTLTITDVGHKIKSGDVVTISGASGFNNIPSSEINSSLFIREIIDDDNYTVTVQTQANATGSGGGASVVVAAGVVSVAATSNGLTEGDRVKIEGATTFAGITDAEINVEHIIRNVATNSFDIPTGGTATSAVTSGGGSSTVYYMPIEAGLADTTAAFGFGAGLYGTGSYGVAKTSQSTVLARLWSHDRYGNLTISCPGDNGGIYSWDGSLSDAPAIILNSPTANYAFVTNSIVVALGYDTDASQANDNGISWCSQGAITNWTTGQAGSDSIEGAGKFITHASARGENLIFTLNQTYMFRYIGGQFIFQTRLLDASIGCISQNARVSASGVIFWMGLNNFYMWRGGNVEVIPSNTGTESTILQYVFNDINLGQKEKIFAWFNPEFREICWHYPSSQSNNPDRIARYNIDERTWCPDTIDRTAMEYPSIITQTPYSINNSGDVFLQENGRNDDTNPISWSLKTRRINGGDRTVKHKAFIPDYNLTGNMSVNLTTRDYPLSSEKTTQNYTVTSSSERVATSQNGRYWQYDLSGNDLNQVFEIGQWYEEIEQSSKK